MASIALRLKSDPKAIIVKTLSYASSHFFSSGSSSPFPPPGQTQNGESTESNATENASGSEFCRQSAPSPPPIDGQSQSRPHSTSISELIRQLGGAANGSRETSRRSMDAIRESFHQLRNRQSSDGARVSDMSNVGSGFLGLRGSIDEWKKQARSRMWKFEKEQGYYEGLSSVDKRPPYIYPCDPLLSNDVIIKESTSEKPDKRDELMVTTGGDRVHDSKQEKLAPNKEKNVVSKKSKSSKGKGKGKLKLRETSEEIIDQLSNCNTILTGAHEQASRKDPVISVTEACVRVRRVEGVIKKQLSYIFIVLIDPHQREALQNMLDDEEIKEWVYHHYFARYGDE